MENALKSRKFGSCGALCAVWEVFQDGSGTGASGVIGSRAGFRFLWLRSCGFKSHLAHQCKFLHPGMGAQALLYEINSGVTGNWGTWREAPPVCYAQKGCGKHCIRQLMHVIMHTLWIIAAHNSSFYKQSTRLSTFLYSSPVFMIAAPLFYEKKALIRHFLT